MPRLTKTEDFFTGQRVRISGDDPSCGKVIRVLENSVVIHWDDMISEIQYFTPIEEDSDRIYPLSENQVRP